MTTQLGTGACETAFRGSKGLMSRHCANLIVYPFQCTAGRAMMFSGFENPEGSLTGGIQATGNYPGKARNASELRADLEQAMRLIPGPKRLNLHAIYLESDTPVSRDQIKPEHFKTGLNGRKPISSVWILTPPVFASAKRRWLYAFPCRRPHSPVLD